MKARLFLPLLVLLVLASASPVLPATSTDPLWPCVQRKVPELLETQFWTGPALPAETESAPTAIDDLARELAQRRIPIADAEQRIAEFAKSQPQADHNRNLQLLYRATFRELNAQRSQMMAGIGRYAKRQIDMAATLRALASENDALRSKPDANAAELARRDENMVLQTRIFEERAKSLTYICEVPTLIEQRIFALSKAIQSHIKAP